VVGFGKPERDVSGGRRDLGASLFTDRFGKGREVMFDPDLPENGIKHRVDRAVLPEPEREGGEISRHPASGLY
jgi:hypothetical protein